MIYKLNESFTCWENFYEKGCQLGIKKYMDQLNDVREKYDGFKNAPDGVCFDIACSIPDENYDIYTFVESMIEYFDWS